MICYVKDVVIVTSTLTEHFDRIDEVFDCIKRAGLNCEILWDAIKHLKRMLDKHGVRPHHNAMKAALTRKGQTRN